MIAQRTILSEAEYLMAEDVWVEVLIKHIEYFHFMRFMKLLLYTVDDVRLTFRSVLGASCVLCSMFWHNKLGTYILDTICKVIKFNLKE